MCYAEEGPCPTKNPRKRCTHLKRFAYVPRAQLPSLSPPQTPPHIFPWEKRPFLDLPWRLGMDRPGRIFGALAALLLACATVFAALGSHYPLLLEPARARLWQIALEFHWTHALLFLILATLPESFWLIYASGLYTLGILLFCGNMYAMAIWGRHPFSTLIPVGGVCFVLGHVSLLFHFLFGMRKSP